MSFSFLRFARASQKGAGLVEYGLLVGLVAVVSIGAVLALGRNVETTFNTVNDEIALDGPITALVLDDSPLPVAQVDEPYFVNLNERLSATFGGILQQGTITSITWEPVALLGGLSFNAATGVISGTPTFDFNTTITFTVTAQAQRGDPVTTSQTFALGAEIVPVVFNLDPNFTAFPTCRVGLPCNFDLRDVVVVTSPGWLTPFNLSYSAMTGLPSGMSTVQIPGQGRPLFTGNPQNVGTYTIGIVITEIDSGVQIVTTRPLVVTP